MRLYYNLRFHYNLCRNKPPSAEWEQTIEPKVISLSTVDMKEEEITVLLKGMKFTPTPAKQDLNGLETDMHEFCRKVRLLDHF